MDEIARAAGVSHPTVATVRAQLEKISSRSSVEAAKTRIGRDRRRRPAHTQPAATPSSDRLSRRKPDDVVPAIGGAEDEPTRVALELPAQIANAVKAWIGEQPQAWVDQHPNGALLHAAIQALIVLGLDKQGLAATSRSVDRGATHHWKEYRV